jgi:hypothetical protein
MTAPELREATRARGQDRTVSPFYAAGVPHPRRACAGCHRWFIAHARLETCCSLACADRVAGVTS